MLERHSQKLKWSQPLQKSEEAGNKVHLSKIARSLTKDIPLKKTIGQFPRNLHSFGEKQSLMQNYLALVKQHAKEDYAVIVIDNSDIPKPAAGNWRLFLKYVAGALGKVFS